MTASLRKKLFRNLVAGLFALALTTATLAPSRCEAEVDSPRVYLLASTYGVMAGTLTGIASLAFTHAPGQHLRYIAIGASLGLYAGLILGTYLIYATPGSSSSKSSSSTQAVPAPKDNKPNSIKLDGSSALDPSWSPDFAIIQNGAAAGFAYRF